MRETKHTTIPDRDGVEHAYKTDPLNFQEQIDLGLKLGALLGGPLAEAFGGGTGEGVLDHSGESLFRGLGRLFGEAIKNGGSKLFADILKNTSRARVVDGGREQWDRLNTPVALDAAYSANLPECIEACVWVLSVNYGPFSGESSGGWGRLLGKLGIGKSAV